MPKTYNPIDDEKYYPVPFRIMSNNKLSPGAKLTAGVLIYFYGKNGKINPKLSTISEKISCSERQIKRYIAELIKYKIISKKKEKYSDSYKFSKPPEGTDMACLKQKTKPEGTDMACLKQKTKPEGTDMACLEGTDMASAYKKTDIENRNNNVVVSLASKYGFEFDANIIEILDGYPDKKLIDLFEYTKSQGPDNPGGFVFNAVKYKWVIPEYKDPYAADRERLEKLRSEAMQAQNLGFKSAGYTG